MYVKCQIILITQGLRVCEMPGLRVCEIDILITQGFVRVRSSCM